MEDHAPGANVNNLKKEYLLLKWEGSEMCSLFISVHYALVFGSGNSQSISHSHFPARETACLY